MSDGVGIMRSRIAPLCVAAAALLLGVGTMLREAEQTPTPRFPDETHETRTTRPTRSSPPAVDVSRASMMPAPNHQRAQNADRRHRPDSLEASIAEARAGSMPVTPLGGTAPDSAAPLAIRVIEARPVEPGSTTWRFSLAVVNVSDGFLGETAFVLTTVDAQPMPGDRRFTIRPLARGRGDMVVLLVDGVPQGFDATRLTARIVSHAPWVESVE